MIVFHILLVFYIIYRQRKFFKETKNKIVIFSDIFPVLPNVYNIKSFFIDKAVLQLRTPQYILSNINELSSEHEAHAEEINLIEPNVDKHSASFAQIRNAINTYLLRNKGSVADFHLIKDVVERYIDAQENEINASVSTPLYYGLLGTMISIVIGLWGFVVQIGDIANFTLGVTELLIGASFGMGTSAYGLWLTVENSRKLKESKVGIENRKNDFYNFIQTELLPILTQNINTGFYQLQLNLQNFNNEFSQNINELKGLMINNHQALKNQTETLDLLKKININEFADANIRILESLRGSTQDLQGFAKYLGGLNEFLRLSNLLNHRVNELLERTEGFDTVATEISQSVKDNHKLTLFLRAHYEELDKRGQLITDAVGRTDRLLDEAFKEMKNNLQDNISEFEKFAHEEASLMKKAFEENRNNLDQLNQLKYLSQMYQRMTNLQGSLEQSNQRFQSTFMQKTDSIEQHLAKLVSLQSQKSMTFLEWIKSKFGR